MERTAARIAVVGGGRVGTALARGLAGAGHDVGIGARDPSRAGDPTAAGIPVTGIAQAVARADVVVLAVPVAALAEVVEAMGPTAGKVLVDATNAVGTPVPGGHATVAEHVAALAPGASVVKAFNTIGAEHLATGTVGGRPAFLPVAGDDAGRPVVLGLAGDLGFDAADLGGWDTVGLVEGAAQLWIHLAFRCGWGRDFGFGVLRP